VIAALQACDRENATSDKFLGLPALVCLMGARIVSWGSCRVFPRGACETATCTVKILGISAPWHVTDVILNMPAGKADVVVEHPERNPCRRVGIEGSRPPNRPKSVPLGEFNRSVSREADRCVYI